MSQKNLKGENMSAFIFRLMKEIETRLEFFCFVFVLFHLFLTFYLKNIFLREKNKNEIIILK